MESILLQMLFIAACGYLWRHWIIRDSDLAVSQSAISSLVFYFLLPALILNVLWQAPLGQDSIEIALSAAAGVLLTMAVAMFTLKFLGDKRRAFQGAFLLAAAFPNATYMGLPVLEKIFGQMGRNIAIQYDLFACTPLLFSIGLYVAGYYGSSGSSTMSFRSLFKTPAVIATFIALGLNIGEVPPPDFFLELTNRMGFAVIPMMLILLGMNMSPALIKTCSPKLLLPVVFLQLILMPLIVWVTAKYALSSSMVHALTIEAGMPSMLLGIVICERYKLDVSYYAAVVTLTTLLSLITLPLVQAMLL